MIRVTMVTILLLGLLVPFASGQEVSPDTRATDKAGPPTQGPLPNNPDAAEPLPQDAGPVVPAEPMSSVACIIWAVVGIGTIALLVWIFGSLRQRGARGAPYADISHNPSVSGPYFPGTAPQPGMGGFTGFLGGLPGVFMVNRFLRRKRRDDDDAVDQNQK